MIAPLHSGQSRPTPPEVSPPGVPDAVQPGVAARRPDGTFLPGGPSGNPRGRPRLLADVQAACKAHTPDAIATLAAIMKRGPARERVMAAIALLDRAWGRPPSALELRGEIAVKPVWPSVIEQLTEAQLEALEQVMVMDALAELREGHAGTEALPPFREGAE